MISDREMKQEKMLKSINIIDEKSIPLRSRRHKPCVKVRELHLAFERVKMHRDMQPNTAFR